MSKIKVKFLKAGNWCDEPWNPVFSVKVGEVVELTPETAELAVNVGKAIYWPPQSEPVESESPPVESELPPVMDKTKALKKRKG